MGKLIGIIAIYVGSISLAGFLAIGLFLSFIYFKKQIQHMTEEKWDLYFKNMNSRAFLIKWFLIYVIALCVIALLAYLLFELFRYEYSISLSKILVLVGILYALLEYIKDKDKLLRKLDRLHQ